MYSSTIDSYYNNPFPFHVRMMDLISQLQLRGDEKILDVGCGDGRITAEISKLLPQSYVVGSDIFPEVIEFAKNKFDRQNYPNLEFQVGDVRSLEFENSFDVIVSCGALHYIHNHIPVLTGFKEALKPSGKILLSFLGEGSNKSFHSVLQELLLDSKWKELNNLSYQFYSPAEYREMLKAVGFTTDSVEIFSYPLKDNNSKKEIKQRVEKDWFSLSTRIPPEIYETFLEELVSIYMERNPPNQSGLIESKAEWLEIQATAIP